MLAPDAHWLLCTGYVYCGWAAVGVGAAQELHLCVVTPPLQDLFTGLQASGIAADCDGQESDEGPTTPLPDDVCECTLR